MNIEQNRLNSMEVAEMVEKNHKELLRDIRRYCEQLSESKIALGDFFAESTYKDANNQDRPCYLVTKKGCEFIAHKLTGVKGSAFTAKYINRFHEMEDQIKDPRKLSAIDQIQLIAQGTVESKNLRKCRIGLIDWNSIFHCMPQKPRNCRTMSRTEVLKSLVARSVMHIPIANLEHRFILTSTVSSEESLDCLTRTVSVSHTRI